MTNVKRKSDRIPGIYCILNKINNKKYIGSTKNLYSRIKEHNNNLLKNKHPNNHLKKSAQLYGAENFDIFILEKCEEFILTKREQFWTDFYDSTNKEKGYNKVKDVVRHSGWTICEEGRANMSRSHLGKKFLSKEQIRLNAEKCMKKVYQYDKNNNFIKEYESIKQAAKENNINSTNISQALHNKKAQVSKGFIWKLDKTNNLPYKKPNKGKALICNETQEIFNNLTECSNKMNIKYCTISKAILMNKKVNKKYSFNWYEGKLINN